MKKNVASQSISAQMTTAADGTVFTGAVSVLVTLDNGTQTAGAGTAPAHEGNGLHSYTPSQAETNGDHIAFTFTGTGAITATIQLYTTYPQTVDNDTKISLIPTTPMRGTDGANTTAPDNASISAILTDTNELQTNQGNWLTATGFSTSADITAIKGVGWDATDTLEAIHNVALSNGTAISGLNDITVNEILTTQMAESYAADGVAPTLAQALMLIQQELGDFSIAGTTVTVKQVDGATTAATFDLDDATSPTSKTRAS